MKSDDSLKMPKKFLSENTKAEAARQRKLLDKEEKKEEKRRVEEDNYWKDDNKYAIRKQQRKEDKEKKKQECSERKELAKAQLEQENVYGRNNEKLTRAQIREGLERKTVVKAYKAAETLEPLEKNVNRIKSEGQVARSVSQAITIFSNVEKDDKHPEKRAKAAFKAFEDKTLPILKEQNPTLRMSQLKELLWKDWEHSDLNPFCKNK